MFIACPFTEVHYNLMKEKKREKNIIIIKGKKTLKGWFTCMTFLIKEDIMKNIGPR